MVTKQILSSSLNTLPPRGPVDRILDEVESRISEREINPAFAILDLVDRVLSTEEPREGYARLVEELKRHLSCRAVVLATASPSTVQCRVVATTGQWDRDEQAAIEATLSECLARAQIGLWPVPENSPGHALLAHKALAKTARIASVFSIPLVDGAGITQGALLILNDESFAGAHSNQQFLRAACQPIASVLRLTRQAEQSWGRRFMKYRRAFRSPKLVALLMGLILTAVMMCLPMPYRMKCDCIVEPVTRRYVAAPFEGILERTVVAPGDFVSEGELLAHLDGREIRWELAGLVAKQSQAAKERDGHLARHDFGAAELARLEVERLNVNEQLLKKRSENLEIRSPIEGIVIAGDLKKSVGSPVKVGQPLFEIALGNRMIVEVAIPEADIRYAKVGQTVDIVLDAFPDLTWSGTLTCIHPRSELREEDHVFIGEVILENPDAILRPGMRGRGKIQGPSKALGWNLFHRPWYELLYWLGW